MQSHPESRLCRSLDHGFDMMNSKSSEVAAPACWHGLSQSDWCDLVREAVGAEGLLPLPPLQQPEPCGNMMSARLRQRAKGKLVAWRIAIGIGAALGWAHSARYGPPFLHSQSKKLEDMSPHHQAAWKGILKESIQLRDSRRAFESTGALSFLSILKVADNIYQKSTTKYVPMEAELIAEPSDPSRSVDMLSSLPQSLRIKYSKESNVVARKLLADPVRTELRQLGRRIGGSKQEYVKYY